MSKLQNLKDKTFGKTKQVIAEIDGDIDLAQEGKAQATKAAHNEQSENRESFLGKLNDLT